MKNLKQKIKEEQKALAQNIRFCRRTRNYEDWQSISLWSYEYRHKHIVYCTLFNNTPYERIENPRENNRPNSGLLDKIRDEWDEIIRSNT